MQELRKITDSIEFSIPPRIFVLLRVCRLLDDRAMSRELRQFGIFNPKICIVIISNMIEVTIYKTNERRRFINMLYIVKNQIGKKEMVYLPGGFYRWLQAICKKPIKLKIVEKCIIQKAQKTIFLLKKIDIYKRNQKGKERKKNEIYR